MDAQVDHACTVLYAVQQKKKSNQIIRSDETNLRKIMYGLGNRRERESGQIDIASIETMSCQKEKKKRKVMSFHSIGLLASVGKLLSDQFDPSNVRAHATCRQVQIDRQIDASIHPQMSSGSGCLSIYLNLSTHIRYLSYFIIYSQRIRKDNYLTDLSYLSLLQRIKYIYIYIYHIIAFYRNCQSTLQKKKNTNLMLQYS